MSTAFGPCSNGRHVPEADLLEMALGIEPAVEPSVRPGSELRSDGAGATLEQRAILDACPECARRFAAYRAFVERVRAVAPRASTGAFDAELVADELDADLSHAELSNADELDVLRGSGPHAFASRTDGSNDHGELIERVLAMTTREDLGTRGDLRLIWGFARARLRGSVALRVAAALLVAHLIALPVLAWVVLRAPKPARHFSSTLILPHDPIYPRESEPEAPQSVGVDAPDVEPQLVEVESGPRDGAQGWLDFARREDLGRWRRTAPRPPLGRRSADGLALLLDLRAAGLAGESITLPPWTWSDDITWAALRVEILLDRWAASGVRPVELDGALRELSLDRRLTSSRLAACCLHRAAAYGAMGGETWSRLLGERGAVSEIALEMAHQSLDRLWRQALAELPRDGASERARAIAAWIDAGR